MLPRRKGHIALISVHGDPAVEIGKEAAGGQNVYVRQVGEALAQRGWMVDMFTRRTNAQQAAVEQHGQRCRTIRLDAGPASFVDRNELYNYVPEFVDSFLSFQHQSGTMYPLIHTNYWLSGAVGIELRKRQMVKLIHTYHSLGTVKYQQVKTVPIIARTRLLVEAQCLEVADRVVATSPQEQEHMRWLISEKGNINVIPCGTDIERFGNTTYADARQALGFANDEKVVLYAGRFDRRKGIETLVRAAGRLRSLHGEKLHLVIVGGSQPGQKDGHERDRIEGIVKELGLASITTFTGRLDHATLSVYYTAADVCAVPSHYEPFGLVAIEAMACGTPVVASNVGGLQFSVRPRETGLLVPPQNDEALAYGLHKILANPEWRDQLGRAGRQRVETHFSWDGVASQLDKLYRQLQIELSQDFFVPAS